MTSRSSRGRITVPSPWMNSCQRKSQHGRLAVHVPFVSRSWQAWPSTSVRVVTRLPSFSMVASSRRSRSRIRSSHWTLSSRDRQRSASSFCSASASKKQKTWPRISCRFGHFQWGVPLICVCRLPLACECKRRDAHSRRTRSAAPRFRSNSPSCRRADKSAIPASGVSRDCRGQEWSGVFFAVVTG